MNNKNVTKRDGKETKLLRETKDPKMSGTFIANVLK